MAVRIGINPITWSNDDLPELGGRRKLQGAGYKVFTLVEFEGE